MKRFITTLVSIALAAVGITAAPAISLTSDFHHGFAPASVKVRIQVEPNPANRLLCLEVDGGSYSRSCWEVDGATAPRTTWRELKRLPAGAYVAVAQIVRTDGSSSISRIEFEVLETFPQ